MRRSDREIKNFEDIIKVIEKCDVCRLALYDEEYPYIIPLNFGLKVEHESMTLYFHGSLKGKKVELINKNNKASFEMDCAHQLVSGKEACSCSMNYESVIGNGTIEWVLEDEKVEALSILMAHYHTEKEFKFNEAILSKTAVFKLTVNTITGKSRS